MKNRPKFSNQDFEDQYRITAIVVDAASINLPLDTAGEKVFDRYKAAKARLDANSHPTAESISEAIKELTEIEKDFVLWALALKNAVVPVFKQRNPEATETALAISARGDDLLIKGSDAVGKDIEILMVQLEKLRQAKN